MTNNNNTRKKANAVFFSVLMVISMVAVGFAAAPAAAVSDADVDGSITTNASVSTNQNAATHDYTIDLNFSNITDNSGHEITLTGLGGSGASVSSVTATSDGVPNVDSTSTSSPQITVNSNGSTSGTTTISGTITIDWSSASASSYDVGATFADASGSSTGSDTLATVTVSDARPSPNNAPTKNVDNGATVFQGEEVSFVGALQGETQLTGVAGDAEGQVIDNIIATDDPRGTYTVSGSERTASNPGVTVAQPRISTAEIRLGDSSEDVDGSSVSESDAENLDIYAEYNFEDAEPIEVTVEDPSGTDITDAVLNTSDSPDGDNALIESTDDRVAIDLGNEDAGEYTVIYEGEDDLDQGSLVTERTIEVTSGEDVSVDVSEDSVTRGTNVEYTVSSGTSGELHFVTIDSDDFRDSFNASQNPVVFRNTGDTDTVGFIDTDDNTATDASGVTSADGVGDIEYAYALVEMDGASGVGTIRTDNFDDTSVNVDVYENAATVAGINDGDDTSVDDDSFDVSEGEITIDSPDGQYTIGSEVDVNGTATGIDNVDVYVRDNNEWELLYTNLEVDSDDEYEEEDQILTQADGIGSSILQQAGTYRYGVIDSSEYNGDSTLTTSEFSQATSTSQSITTVEGELNAQLETINGQINTDDNSADITGNAEGQRTVTLAFVDQRGDVAAEEIEVESDGTIDIEDYDIPQRSDGDGNLDAGSLAEGTVTAHFVSPGRDDNIGDGEIPGGQDNDAQGLANWINENVSGSNLNAEQARARIVSETTEDTASDDLMITQSFRYAESQTTIDSVYPEEAQADGVNPVATGETMVVAGSTNLRPDDNSITVEVLNEDGDSLVISSTDEWETNGQWSASVDTGDLEPGTYTVESDDGTNTDRAEIEIVEERQTDDGDDGEDDSTDGDDGSTDGDDGSTDGDDGGADGDDGGADGDDGGSDGEDGGSDGGDGGTDDSTPGFGALVALVALIAAALLATRRDN